MGPEAVDSGAPGWFDSVFALMGVAFVVIFVAAVVSTYLRYRAVRETMPDATPGRAFLASGETEAIGNARIAAALRAAGSREARPLKDRLRELEEAHAEGFLTDAEYAAARNRLING